MIYCCVYKVYIASHCLDGYFFRDSNVPSVSTTLLLFLRCNVGIALEIVNRHSVLALQDEHIYFI